MSVKKISDLGYAEIIVFCDDMADVQTEATKACFAIADKYGLDRKTVFGVFTEGVKRAMEDDFFWEVVVPANFDDEEG